MLREIRSTGAVSVACHPHETSERFANTWYLWNRRELVGDLVDLWEGANRWELFPVVTREALPPCANSDFHAPEHLYAWKTLLRADRSVSGILRALRRGTGIGVLRLTAAAAEIPAGRPSSSACSSPPPRSTSSRPPCSAGVVALIAHGLRAPSRRPCRSSSLCRAWTTSSRKTSNRSTGSISPSPRSL